VTASLPVSAIAELRHELRTPINLITGYGEMLLEDLPPNDSRVAHLEQVRTAANTALTRINAALPPSGVIRHGGLEQLLEELFEPQQQILSALEVVRAATTDLAVHADLDKIAAAARRLTAVPRPMASYNPPAPPSAPVTQSTDDVVVAPDAARILIVDDLEDNRAVLARRLVRQGYRVDLAENGRVALERLASEQFDLVLLDVMMPEIDGFQVLERMRADPDMRRIPVIMISALDDMSSVVRCIEFGAEDYLAKPFDPVLLRARIGAALEKKRLRDREAEYLRHVARLTEAAAAFERGQYSSSLLGDIGERSDELGRLARVFDAMVAGIRAREDRLRGQLRELRADVSAATSELPIPRPDDDQGLLAPGAVFADRYEIAGVLGRGGMGLVYRAHDRQLGEDVALKMLRAEILIDEDVLERFKNEIRLARRISHRNVVRTHDFGEAGGAYFVTMEYVRGITVRELLQNRGSLSVSSTLALARQIVEALTIAHGAGIIHRDIKPENALLDDDGALKVMDFGIARLNERTSTVTQAGMTLGTPAYMSPEQLLGEEIDHRTDLYAVGAVMFECLTGRPPFYSDYTIAMISRTLSTPAAFPENAPTGISAALRALVLSLLAKSPSDRPQRATDLLELIGELN
jgi:CheY-like chemotaxis protein/predicted Ser/Thr protein kinase